MESKQGHKYLSIKSAGRKLIWKHGIRRINVDDICSEAGVSRMTFYKYFRNKNELALDVLQTFYDESMKRYEEIMKSEVEFPEKARQLILMKIEGTNDLSKEFVTDIFNMQASELSTWYHKIYQDFLERLVEDLNAAQKKGEIRKDLKIEFVLYFMGKTYEMATDTSLLSHYNSPQEMIVELINFFFYGIMPVKGRTK
ncbi:MAG: TetR/AcrR family transcriptional regulator [Bacteroidales bacterium]